VCVQEPLLPSGACTRYVERNQNQYVNCGEWLLAALSVKVRNGYMQNFCCASIQRMGKSAKNISPVERVLAEYFGKYLEYFITVKLHS
jgi:hypothetical protein